MSTTGTHVNSDGLLQRYGAAHRQNFTYNRPRQVLTDGVIQEIVLPFDLGLVDSTFTNGVTYTEDLDNDGVRDGFTPGDAYIPAGAYVVDAYIYMTETAAGGTAIDVGSYEEDGTAIDADGFFDATDLTVASNKLDDGVFYGGDAGVSETGPDVGVQLSATKDAFVAIDCTGTFTAGKGVVIIRYIDELAV